MIELPWTLAAIANQHPSVSRAVIYVVAVAFAGVAVGALRALLMLVLEPAEIQ